MRPLLLVLSLLAALPAVANDRPTRAALQRALAQHERSAVHVRGPRQAGPGIIIGAQGQVLTAAALAGPDSARITVAAREHGGTVLHASRALRVAVLSLGEGTWSAAPVWLLSETEKAPWLIGITRGKDGRATPRAARARRAEGPFLDVALALAPGSPLYDAQGRLVAIAVERRGKGARVLPVAAVKRALTASAEAP